MNRNIYLFIIWLLFSLHTDAQNPFTHWTDALEVRYSSRQPVIHYLINVDSKDLSYIKMEMRISNIPDTFHVAMVAHPEYDDKYWRYVEDFYAETANGIGKIERKDSALWRVITKGKKVTLHYRIHLPSSAFNQRSAWKAFLSSNGGLVGGPHSFMYVLGESMASSYVTLNIPNEWKIVTGLTATSDVKTFFASSVFNLIDGPILIGKIKTWPFTVDGVPHRVVYWPWPVNDFDSTKLVNCIQKLVEQASKLFGRFPYREYSFMLQDSAVGALEHNNSVTIGASVTQLRANFTGVFSELAHEYFHTWNLVRIHPLEYGDVTYQSPPLSKGLWYSEGLTIFYADLLRRRAGLPTFDSTRLSRLELLIRRYAGNPGYSRFSAEKISLASYGPPGMLGDYSASTHLQGELLGVLLDIIIRDASDGKRSMDEVMRKMMERFSGKKGFTSKDIEQIISKLCGLNLHPFFEDYIFGNKPVDFDKYLRLMGLQKKLEWKEVKGEDGNPSPDLRVYSWHKPNETEMRIGITDPSNCWGKAGLHTGDIIKSVNGTEIKNGDSFREVIRRAKISDNIIIEVMRPTGIHKTNVVVSGYRLPEVHITQKPGSTEKQKRLFTQWASGN